MRFSTTSSVSFAVCAYAIQASSSFASHPYSAAADHGESGPYPVFNFVSTKIEAPRINFKQWAPECDDGLYYFITPRGWKVPEPGPMILDGNGDLVWSEQSLPADKKQAYDLRVQQYQSKPILTFWLGDDRDRGHGMGHYYMLNSSYDVFSWGSAAKGEPCDLHEFLITPQGTALVIIYEVKVINTVLPEQRMSDKLFGVSYIWENIIQEVDIQSRELLFEWRASEHVNINDTYHKVLNSGTQADPFDWFHVNSVDKDALGNYLICTRYTHAIYYIDGKTKDIIWTLGGKRNSFMDLSEGLGLNFAWQHDARFVDPYAFPETYKPVKKPKKLMTLFDNSAEDWNYEYGPTRSRGLLLELNWPTKQKERPTHADVENAAQTESLPDVPFSNKISHQDAEKLARINGTDPAYTVRVVKEYINTASIRSSSQGSLQLLAQGKGKDPKVLVDYGLAAVMTEFSGNGTPLCDIRFGAETSWETGDVQSYRAFKFPWVGRPRYPPSVAVKGDTLYVSWNGATEVDSWRLQASETGNRTDWPEGEIFVREGFETTFQLPSDFRKARYLRVLALDKKGEECEHGSVVFDHGKFTALLRQHVTTSHTSSMKTALGLLCALLGFYFLYISSRICIRRLKPNRGAEIRRGDRRNKQV